MSSAVLPKVIDGVSLITVHRLPPPLSNGNRSIMTNYLYDFNTLVIFVRGPAAVGALEISTLTVGQHRKLLFLFGCPPEGENIKRSSLKSSLEHCGKVRPRCLNTRRGARTWNRNLWWRWDVTSKHLSKGVSRKKVHLESLLLELSLDQKPKSGPSLIGRIWNGYYLSVGFRYKGGSVTS